MPYPRLDRTARTPSSRHAEQSCRARSRVRERAVPAGPLRVRRVCGAVPVKASNRSWRVTSLLHVPTRWTRNAGHGRIGRASKARRVPTVGSRTAAPARKRTQPLDRAGLLRGAERQPARAHRDSGGKIRVPCDIELGREVVSAERTARIAVPCSPNGLLTRAPSHAIERDQCSRRKPKRCNTPLILFSRHRTRRGRAARVTRLLAV